MKNKFRQSERGGAGIKLILVLLVLGLLAYAGLNYVPVAYQGESFKQEMETVVVKTTALPSGNKPVTDTIKERLTDYAKINSIPSPVIDVKQVNNNVQAHVTYSKQVPILPFGIYNRTYVFDHTATPTGFLTK